MPDVILGEFSTDVTSPVVTNNTPTGLGVSRSSDIEFDITDTETGTDTSSIIVVVDGTIAFSAGSVKNGYTGGLSGPVGGTHHMTLTPPSPHANLATINISVDAQDLAPLPNIMPQFLWSFVTVDDIGPVVTNNEPTGIDQLQTVDVIFDISDNGAGVDLANTVVTIGGTVAFDGVNFVNGYDGVNSEVTGTPASYHFVIDRETLYGSLTLYDVDVDSQDLYSIPNVMATFSWPFTTEESDLVGPVFSNRSPAPAETDVDRDTDIGFRVVDAINDVNDPTIVVTINGHFAVTGGAQAPGYSLTLTPVSQGYDVVIDPDDDLDFYQTYTIYAEAEDTEGNLSTTTWQFITTTGLIVSPILQASAGNGRVSLAWSLPPPELMRQDRFDLRRSLTAFPETPSEGVLVYQGPNKSYVDLDVDNGVTYYYTVFVLLRPGEYVPYEVQASATGRPRLVESVVVQDPEYVPLRGDFGTKTINPLPYGRVTRVWGSRVGDIRRQSDLISVPSNRVVRAPVQGTVRDVIDYVGVLKTVEIEVASGIVISLSGILASVSRGGAVNVGQVIGSTVGGQVEFEIYKLPTDTTGRRTVRPRYFYLTAENRDGRE